jgi:hemolysin activation/secretion protein
MHYSVIEVEETQGRFINTFFDLENEDNENTFLGGEFSYSYENKDSNAFPTLGMAVDFTAGFTSNLDESNSFGYIIPSIEFDHKLSANGQLVLATKFKGHLTLGDDFEFYQAASLGASDGLRGYRNQRFTGKSAFYNSTDIRLNLRKYRTGFLPFNFGIYGGMDNGRVWVDGQDSDSWNNSIGGGIFFNGANKLVGNISAFNSDDGMRLAFRLGFGF